MMRSIEQNIPQAFSNLLLHIICLNHYSCLWCIPVFRCYWCLGDRPRVPNSWDWVWSYTSVAILDFRRKVIAPSQELGIISSKLYHSPSVWTTSCCWDIWYCRSRFDVAFWDPLNFDVDPLFEDHLDIPVIVILASIRLTLVDGV